MRKTALILLFSIAIISSCENDRNTDTYLETKKNNPAKLRLPIPPSIAEPFIENYINNPIVSNLGLNIRVKFAYQSFKQLFIENGNPDDIAIFNILYDTVNQKLDFSLVFRSDTDQYSLVSGDHVLRPVDQQFHVWRTNYVNIFRDSFKTNSLKIRVDSVLNYCNFIETNGNVDSLAFIFAIVDTTIFDANTPSQLIQAYEHSHNALTRMVEAELDDGTMVENQKTGGILYYNADDLCPPACGGGDRCFN